jgi:NAD(P)-dependent dehydrogenase (short-subunit alcohol dehydrogenase family)
LRPGRPPGTVSTQIGVHKTVTPGAHGTTDRNVTGVQGDAGDLDDLDRLYDTVKREKGSLDVLWASAGVGEPI